MRIVLLNQFYRPDTAATAQLLTDLAEALCKSGHEVHVVCSRRCYGGGTRRHATEQKQEGVQIHRVSATGFGRTRWAGRVCDYASFFLLAAARLLTLPRMDVCVCLTTPPFIGLAGAMLKRIRGTRLVLWTMDLFPQVAVAYGTLRPDTLFHRVLAGASKYSYRRASRIISLGEVMKQKLVAAGADQQKIVTVDNWVPRDSVEPISAQQSSFRRACNINGEVTLMYCGNLGLGNELDTVLRATARVADGLPLRVLFIGQGTMRQPLENLRDELALDCVDFHLPRPLDQLSDTLAAGDIHIVSQPEGSQGLIVPSKIYGAMAAGRPTLFIGPHDCEAARIVCQSKAGIIIRPGDVHHATEALRSLATDAGLRCTLGRNARDYYEKHFGRERSVGRIVEVINVAGSS